MTLKLRHDSSGYLTCEHVSVFYLLMLNSGIMGAYTYVVRGGVFCNAQTANFLMLGISLGERAFVTEIRPQTNEVVIGNRAQACQTVLRANHLNFMAREDIQEEDHVFAKIRYNHKGAYCHVKRTGEDEITCTFEEPQHAITPGQAVVLYEDGYVLGGGTII